MSVKERTTKRCGSTERRNGQRTVGKRDCVEIDNIVDTGDKLITGVIDAGDKSYPRCR